jgi:hypothetical protein
MAITTGEARGQILDRLAAALDQLALTVACLGEAYELLDEATADRLEAQLFRPAQKAYGRGKRTLAGFASRYGLDSRELNSPTPGVRSQGVKSFVGRAVEASSEAERRIAELQDSMLPIEAGDAELRAGLTEVRDLLAGLPAAAREFLRVLGR